MRVGALSYCKTDNLGDEIQTLAALRFVGTPDLLVDRDLLGTFESPDPVALILNGWFGHRPESWPPSDAIRPLLISMHLSSVVSRQTQLTAPQTMLHERAVTYLRAHGPVGTRDLTTLELLQKHDVPAYFSGCMTLTLQRDPAVERGADIVLNDVPEAVAGHVRRTSHRTVVHTTHDDLHTEEPAARLDRARRLLRLYQSAHCVITTRLHCALPALALGTPVLFLHVGQESTRFTGLLNLVRSCTIDDFLQGRSGFSLEAPTPNRDDHLVLRAGLERSATEFIARARADSLPPRLEPVAAELRHQTFLAVHTEHLRTCAAEATTVQTQLSRAQAELERDRQESQRLRDELVRVGAELTGAHSELETERARHAAVAANLATLQAERERIFVEREQLEAEKARVQAERDRLAQVVEGLRQQLKGLQDQIGTTSVQAALAVQRAAHRLPRLLKVAAEVPFLKRPRE